MIEFLAPHAWVIGIAALVPVTAAAVHGRRDRRVRHVLELSAPRRWTRMSAAVAGALAILLLAAAAAKPAVRTRSALRIRTDAQVFFVVDVTRSMLARERHGASRFDRARRLVERFQAAMPDVPAGVASLTDRPLPHLFPTTNRRVVSAVLWQSLAIEQPPPTVGSLVAGRATSFDPIPQLATAGYFGSRARHKLVVLLTDGESAAYSPEAVLTRLRGGHVGLLVVRFWRADERVFTKGRAEAYRPDASTLPPLRVMAGRSVGLYRENDEAGAIRAAKTWLGSGPTVSTGRPSHLELSPYVAAAAVVPLALLLWRRDP